MTAQDNMTSRAPFGVARDFLASGAKAAGEAKAKTGTGRLVLLSALTQAGALSEVIAIELTDKAGALTEYTRLTLSETLTSPLLGKGVEGSKLRQTAVKAQVWRGYFGMNKDDVRAPAIWTAWNAVLPVACAFALKGVRLTFELGGKDTAKPEARPVRFRVEPVSMELDAIAAASAAQAAFEERGFSGLKAWAEKSVAPVSDADDGAKGHASDDADHGSTVAASAALQSAAMEHFRRVEGYVRQWTSTDGECSVALPAEGSLDFQRLVALRDMLADLLAD